MSIPKVLVEALDSRALTTGIGSSYTASANSIGETVGVCITEMPMTADKALRLIADERG